MAIPGDSLGKFSSPLPGESAGVRGPRVTLPARRPDPPLPREWHADAVDTGMRLAFPVRVAGGAGARVRRATAIIRARAVAGDAIVGAAAEEPISEAAIVELAGPVVAGKEDAAVGVGRAALVQLAAAQADAGVRELEVTGVSAALAVVGAGLGSRARDAAGGALALLLRAATSGPGARLAQRLVLKAGAAVAAGAAAAVSGRGASLPLVGAHALRIGRGAVPGDAVGIRAAVALPENDLAEAVGGAGVAATAVRVRRAGALRIAAAEVRVAGLNRGAALGCARAASLVGHATGDPGGGAAGDS